VIIYIIDLKLIGNGGFYFYGLNCNIFLHILYVATILCASDGILIICNVDTDKSCLALIRPIFLLAISKLLNKAMTKKYKSTKGVTTSLLK